MHAKVVIDAGICGFQTVAQVAGADDQNVTFEVRSDCDKINRLGRLLRENGPIDAYREIDPRGESVLLCMVRSTLSGCCAGCAVPVGLLKAMQVAAGLALPKDVHIQLHRE